MNRFSVLAYSLAVLLLVSSINTIYARPDSTGAECLSCHDGSGSNVIHRIAGTVFSDESGSEPAYRATVSLTNVKGTIITLNETNEYGNFWASADEVPEGTYLTKVNNFQSRLWHKFPKERDDCNTCHIPGGNGNSTRTVILDSYPENCHTLCPISNNCQHCHFKPSPYAPKDVMTTGTLNASKPAVIMPSVSRYYINEKWYDFDPAEHDIQTTRPDVFAANYFSIFDVILTILDKNNIAVEYDYDEDAKCHFITSLDGKPGNYWYKHIYHNNEFEYMTGFETVPYRWDELLWKPGTKGEITNVAPPRQEFIEGVQRDGDGFTIVPKVIIDKNTYTDVKVTPHNYLSENAYQPHMKPFKDGVISALDVLFSLQDEGLINNVRLTYYDFINYACIKTKKWNFETGSYVGSFIVTRINDRNHRGHNGWFFCQTEAQRVLHVTAGLGVIHGCNIVQWFPSRYMGMTVSDIFQIEAKEYYWDVGDENYKDGDTTDFVTAIDDAINNNNIKTFDNKASKKVLTKGNFSLHNPTPNPFSSVCTIHYSIFQKASKSQNITIAVFDVHGKKVTTLYYGTSGEGRKKLTWRPVSVPPGYYIVNMTYGNTQQNHQVIYLQHKAGTDEK